MTAPVPERTLDDLRAEVQKVLDLEKRAIPCELSIAYSHGDHNNAADAVMVGEESGAFCVPVGLRTLTELLVSLRNTAPSLLRRQQERIEKLEATVEAGREWRCVDAARTVLNDMLDDMLTKAEANIEDLEAERDIWKERANGKVSRREEAELRHPQPFATVDWPDPTPSEIAARIRQRRGEQKLITGGSDNYVFSLD